MWEGYLSVISGLSVLSVEKLLLYIKHSSFLLSLAHFKFYLQN